MSPDDEAADSHRPDDFVQSVGRALRILETVSETPALQVKAIARRCRLNLSTTYHLVRTLAYEGYLVRLADGSYVVGNEVARRFHDLMDSLDRPPASTDVLRALVDHTRLSAYLGTVSGASVIVAECVEGPRSPYLEDFESGLEVAAHATALGKALLASMPRGERRQFLRQHEMCPFTARTRVDPIELDRELDAYPRNGVVVEHGEFRDEVACAATLVPSDGAGARWALVVSVRGMSLPAGLDSELALAARHLAASVPSEPS
jgi:DNA-binding IclR family transcriptional regulator